MQVLFFRSRGDHTIAGQTTLSLNEVESLVNGTTLDTSLVQSVELTSRFCGAQKRKGR